MVWWVVAYRTLVSAPGPFGTNWVFELIGTWLGLVLGGLGPGLDNSQFFSVLIPHTFLRKYFVYDFVFGKSKTNLRLYSFHCFHRDHV